MIFNIANKIARDIFANQCQKLWESMKQGYWKGRPIRRGDYMEYFCKRTLPSKQFRYLQDICFKNHYSIDRLEDDLEYHQIGNKYEFTWYESNHLGGY
jgi:hypothetical protein